MKLDGLRVAVVGIYFAPETTGNAPYTTDLCRLLAEGGADVTAVAGLPHYPEWQVRTGYTGPRPTPDHEDGITIVRARHYVPDQQDALRRGRYEASFLRHGRTASRRVKADLVIGVTPTLSSGAVARAIAKRNNAPLVLQVQDLVGAAAAQSGISGGSRVASGAANLEGRVLRSADHVVVIAPGFERAVHALGVPADRTHWIRNYSHVTASTQTQAEARAALGWDSDKFLVVHTGNMGLKQGLDNVVEAARLAQNDDSVRFVFVGDGNQREHLQALAAGLPNVQFVDPLPGDLYPSALAAADVLLLNEREGVLEMSLPSKLTSYFVAARPVIGAVELTGETAKELMRSGAASVVSAGNPAALVAGVRALKDDAELRSRLASTGTGYAASALSREAARTSWFHLIESMDERMTPRKR